MLCAISHVYNRIQVRRYIDAREARCVIRYTCALQTLLRRCNFGPPNKKISIQRSDWSKRGRRFWLDCIQRIKPLWNIHEEWDRKKWDRTPECRWNRRCGAIRSWLGEGTWVWWFISDRPNATIKISARTGRKRHMQITRCSNAWHNSKLRAVNVIEQQLI